MSTINRTAHGLTASQRIVISSLVGGSPLDVDFPYYVLAAGLTADTFQISETDGGSPLTFAAITSAQMQVVPETETTDTFGNGTYTAITDPTNVMAPPSTPPTPSVPTVTSAQVAGIVRLRVHLNDTAEVKARMWEVQITSKFDGAGAADWATPQTNPMPENSTELSIPALGATNYAVRVRMQDVYGNFSAYCADTLHTTLAGSDSLSAALALLSSSVLDGSITETSIAPGSITTPLLAARAVTSDILATTLLLSSLIKTSDTGRRIEIDIDGIRLYDTDESLLVRIPTNGDPVFVKGQITADSLVSQVAASFRGTVDLASSSVSTAQSGISAPANVPSLTASVDSLALTGTALPSSAIGIAYDSGAGTFWVAVDPATGYVAYEYNATTGAFVRRISATGSTSTTTATSGSTSHVSDTAQGIDGSTNSHITTPMVMPSPSGATNMKITKVSAYFAGHNGSCQARVGVWSTGNSSLRESATFTASSGGATTLGASDHYDKALSSPLSVAAGTTYRVGFRHTDTTEGFQFDRDDGSGKTTYSGDGSTADGTGWGTLNSASKPNIYFTYTYDVDTRLETNPMIGVATDGTYIYTLDTAGVVWKYDRTTMAHVAHSAVQTAITGTKSKAGLFYDATATELIITTTTGTGAGVFPKFVRVTPSTLAVSSTVYSASAGSSFSGTTDTFRGGTRVADALNASAATYWISTTSSVYAYTFSGTVATQTSNRDFGLSTTVGDGLTYDGTKFRGFDSASLSKVWIFTGWDWTTASAVYWIGYSWYDSVGTVHETSLGPRASITMRRHERIQITTPSIPVGGVDDPNNVRIYALPGATDFAGGAGWLQITDALTSRYMTIYTGSGTHDSVAGIPTAAFPSGTPAELKSAATGWSLKGDGTATFGKIAVSGLQTIGGASFPVSPATGGVFWRTDLHMEFYYDGTRWLSTTLYDRAPELWVGAGGSNISATTAGYRRGAAPPTQFVGGSDIWIERFISDFYVVTGGTALGASHKWVATLEGVADNTNLTLNTISTGSVDSGSSAVTRQLVTTVGALLHGATQKDYVQVTWTKTGTPGALQSFDHYTYRIVAT